MQPNPWKIGWQAVRDNRVPGLILQAAAFGLLAAYYGLPAVHQALTTLAREQERYGLVCALASYVFFCGVLPYLFCLAVPLLRPRYPLKALLFALFFWGVMGVIVNRFYALQALLYGNDANAGTLVKKVLTDQLGYTLFFASPVISVAHLWKDRGYRWSAVAPLLGKGWYRRLVLPNLVMNWVVWIPSLCVIYSLPTPLQSHVAGLIGGFWALMSLRIAAHTADKSPGDETGLFLGAAEFQQNRIAPR